MTAGNSASATACEALALSAQRAVRVHCSALPPLMLAVIGPPGSGKSTVVQAITQHEHASVFRLREAVRAYADVVADLPPSADPLGWVSDEAVARVMGAAFLRRRFPAGDDPILLDNLPGTASQLHKIACICAVLGRRVAILELQADTATVTARVTTRRVCPGCGPDPHAPATAAASDPEICARCRGTLQRRDTDAPHLHTLRLGRYQANRPKIAAAAARLRIPHLILHADHPAPVVSRLEPVAFGRRTADRVH